MRTIAFSCLMLLWAAGPAWSAAKDMPTSSPVELSVAGTYYIPNQDDDWDYGLGGELQLRIWANPSVGVALAGGGSYWQINEDSGVSDNGLVVVEVDVEGGAVFIPVGGSLLIRAPLGENAHVVFEGGVRYVIAESNIEVTGTASNGSASRTIDEEFEFDDGVVGVVGAYAEAGLSANSAIFGGIGYQFNIDEPTAEFEGEDVGDVNIEALYVRFGLVTRL